jgi:hypothetical protein
MPLSRKYSPMAHAGVGREELQRCGLRRGRGDDDGIFHRAVLFELTHDLRDGRALLADGDVDAVELLALVAPALTPSG